MIISGCIILRNAVINDYPFVESIRSVLPLVDEMVVAIDSGDDNTAEVVATIHDPKIKIIHSSWDMSKRSGGVVYAEETNKVLDAVRRDATWIIYIQADEVFHEKDYPAIREAIRLYASNPKVQGLLFNYLHFYGTYDYIGTGRQWYKYEVRIIKNNPSIRSYKDAQGFRIGKQKIPSVKINATVFHYGWVKSPGKMKKKIDTTMVFYNSDDEGIKRYREEVLSFSFDNFGKLDYYKETHPLLMQERIRQKNWNLDFDVKANNYSLKDRLLMFFEKLTGVRPFDFTNYKIVKS